MSTDAAWVVDVTIRTGVMAPTKDEALLQTLEALPVDVSLGSMPFGVLSIAIRQSNEHEVAGLVDSLREADRITRDRPPAIKSREQAIEVLQEVAGGLNDGHARWPVPEIGSVIEYLERTDA